MGFEDVVEEMGRDLPSTRVRCATLPVTVVKGAVQTCLERSAAGTLVNCIAVVSGDGKVVRATVWPENPEVIGTLRAACLLADIDLAIVNTGEASMVSDQDNDLLIIDCSLDRPEALERCRTVVEQTVRPVHIIHPRASIPDELRSVARYPDQLTWTSTDEVGLPLLQTLLTLRRESLALQALNATLASPRAAKRAYLCGMHETLAAGIGVLIRALPWLEVMGESADGAEAVEDVTRLQPDGILVASASNGYALQALALQLHEACPHGRLLVFAPEVDADLELALEPLGTWGFVTWDTATQAQVLTASAAVLLGNLKVASARAAEVAVRTIERHARSRDEIPALTHKQRVVMHGLADGLSEKAIADREGMGERTVQALVRDLKPLFNAKHLRDLKRMALAGGFGHGEA